VRVAAAQLPGSTGEAGFDIATAADAVRSAAASGAELVLLPELATLPYFGGSPAGAFRDRAEPVPGPLTDQFGALAAELGIVVVLPLFEHDVGAGTWHNSVVVLDAAGTVVPAVDRHGTSRPTARKLHLPVGDTPAPGFDETAHFAPGDGLGVHDLGGLRVGVLVCYDRRFPECWRELRSLGVDVALVPVAGSGGDDEEFVVGEIRTHARENGVAAIVASKVGPEHVDGHTVDNVGESFVVAADGTVLARRTRADGPGTVLGNLDPAQVRATRRELRYYAHRRTDLFGGPSREHDREPA
jgi:N-carbamoylputrescine amidase